MYPENKLRQVDTLVEGIHLKCMELYQCDVEVAVNERMVKSKCHSGMQQYNKDNPTKWGIKIWVLEKLRTDVSSNGLGYDMMQLIPTQ